MRQNSPKTMTPIPLDQLGFGWRSHKSAMWWLGLLYRRPKDVHSQLDQMPKLAAAKTGFALYWHNLPYLVFAGVIARFIIFDVFGVQLVPNSSRWFFHASNIFIGIVFGIIGGIALGIIGGIGTDLTKIIIGFIAGSIAGGILGSIILGIHSSNAVDIF
jgi:hypothetical protein